MLLAQKIAVGSVALNNYLNRKPFSTNQSSQDVALPVELILLICDHLSIQDQVRASRICKHWFNALLGLPWVQYLQQYGDAPAHFFAEGFNWNKELRRREAAETNFSEGRYWSETLASTPANVHSRRYYLVPSVRGMEVLVNLYLWHMSSYEQDAQMVRSFSIDLAKDISTETRHVAGMWLNGVLTRPVFNSHGMDWTQFGIYRPATELEEENGASYVPVYEHDLEKDHKLKTGQFMYFRITEPEMRFRVLPNSKPGSNRFLLYTEPFKRLKRGENYNHTVFRCGMTAYSSTKDFMHSFDGILAYWGDYIVTSTERSIEFYNTVTRITDRVYPLNLEKLVFAKVGIHGNIMAYTSDDRTIAVYDLKQNKMLSTFNYVKRAFGDEEEPESLYLLGIAVHGRKVALNFGWPVVIDWSTKKHIELPYFDVEQLTFLPDGSLMVASKWNVARIRFDVDTTQTVKLSKLVNDELETEPVVLSQLNDYLTSKYKQRWKSLTFLITEPTGYPSYKGTQIQGVARVTAFWNEETEQPSTNKFMQALRQLQAPAMTSSAHEKERCVELEFNNFKPKDPVFLYERFIDGLWTPCNPFLVIGKSN